MNATPQYSSVEEAYKRVQISALEQTPFQAEISRRLAEINQTLIESKAAQLGILQKPAGGVFN